jgi:hypothetical protein
MKKKVSILFLFLASCCCIPTGESKNNANVFGTGQYSSVYLGDWSNLPNGKATPRSQYANEKILEVIGDTSKKVHLNEEEVHLKNIRIDVRWKNPYHKYRNTLYLIRNCDRVIVDNVHIKQLDSDYRASSSIFIEDCKEVVIKDSYLAGTTNNYHIRIEGCETVLIDNVEIEGLDYFEKGIRCGGGIFVNNGDPKMGGKRGMLSPSPKDLKWCVIQNSYIHNNLASDKKRNQDGILVHSAADGLIFNCYFENWQHGDAAIDVSHRRSDKNYRNHFFRVERNVFDNCDKVKTPGISHKSNNIFFANNVYINTIIGDYHNGWDVYHVHETFLFNSLRKRSVFYSIWTLNNGFSYIRNSLVYVSGDALKHIYYQGKSAISKNYNFLRPDFMVYIMLSPSSWLKGREIEIKNWESWKNETRDYNSYFIEKKNTSKDYGQKDYQFLTELPTRNIGCNHFLRKDRKSVLRDFQGKKRTSNPSVGAFEAY